MSSKETPTRIPFIVKKILGVICVFDFDHVQEGASFEDNAAYAVSHLVNEGHDVTLQPVIYRDNFGVWNYLEVNQDGRLYNFLSFGKHTTMEEAIELAKERAGLTLNLDVAGAFAAESLSVQI
jgi:hypothetical protein